MRKRMLIVSALACLFAASTTTANPMLGRTSLLNMPTRNLVNNMSISTGMRNIRFVGAIGGVAFGKKAMPTSKVRVQSLSLRYDAANPDGKRLVVQLNRKALSVAIPDWQLIPIVTYANEDQEALFTAFGTTGDEEKDQKIRQQRGFIFSYHHAIVNTLLGFRVMQADMMFTTPDAVDLPKDKGRYLLGKGEVPPDLKANRAALSRFEGQMVRVFGNRGGFRSYVLGDLDQTISFQGVGDSLRLTGNPRYNFWRFRGEKPASGKNPAQASTRFLREINQQLAAAHSDSPDLDEKQWLVRKIQDELSHFSDEAPVPDDVKQQLALMPLAAQSADVAELKKALAVVRLLIDQMSIDLLTEASKALSQEDLIRPINPSVYDAVRNVMRYAAFFRYVRAEHPKAWGVFMQQVRGAKVPRVETPGAMIPNRS